MKNISKNLVNRSPHTPIPLALFSFLRNNFSFIQTSDSDSDSVSDSLLSLSDFVFSSSAVVLDCLLCSSFSAVISLSSLGSFGSSAFVSSLSLSSWFVLSVDSSFGGLVSSVTFTSFRFSDSFDSLELSISSFSSLLKLSLSGAISLLLSSAPISVIFF